MQLKRYRWARTAYAKAAEMLEKEMGVNASQQVNAVNEDPFHDEESQIREPSNIGKKFVFNQD